MIRKLGKGLLGLILLDFLISLTILFVASSTRLVQTGAPLAAVLAAAALVGIAVIVRFGSKQILRKLPRLAARLSH